MSIMCTRREEALSVHAQVQSYFKHGIKIPDAAVILDVGANIGLFTLECFSRGKVAQVLAFEPAPATLQCLEHNVQNVPVQIIRAAVSSTAGEMMFTSYPFASSMSTLYPQSSRERVRLATQVISYENSLAHLKWILSLPAFLRDALIAFLLQFVFYPKKVKVPVIRLTDVIHTNQLTRIDLLKIDIEGAEWEALQGLTSQDWAMVQQAVLEVHHVGTRVTDVVTLLESMGFARVTIEADPSLGDAVKTIYATREV
jgi:phthiocerol/phenolphthiocerol synthesis type-I polyketide synthase E